MKTLIGAVALVLALAAPAAAQVGVDADRLYLWSGGSARCVVNTGNGAPSGGATCDHYIDYSTGDLYGRVGGVWQKINTYGTVTSVGLSLPAELSVSGSPVTTSGTLSASWAPALTNLFFAAPNGSTGTPSFRAIVNADIAGAGAAVTKTDDINVTLALGGSATAGAVNTFSLTLGWSGQLAVGRGGTGASTLASNGVLYGAGTGAVQVTAAGGANTVLTASGGAPSFSSSPTVTSLAATSYVGSSTYTSQTTGWRATASDGAGDFRYLFTDELRAKLFTAEKEAVLAGSQRVTKSYSTVSQTFTCPAAGGTATLWVYDSPTFGDAAVFVSGDSVVIHAMTRSAFGPFTIADCVGVVTAYADGTGANAGQQSWTFTRNASTNGGSMTASTTVAVNELVQDFGTSGNGYIEDTAVDGAAGVNAPYTQVVTWATAPVAANLTTRCRLGNLKGITAATEYGLLCGSFSGNAYVRLSDANAEIKGIPLSLLSGSTTTIKLDASVPSFAMGATLPTAYGTGTGFWMGNDSGTYKLRIGNPAGDRVTWDGATLAVTGTLTATTGTIGGWTLGATTLTGGSLTLDASGNVRAGQTAYNTGTGFWLGTVSGTPKFSIGAGSGDHLLWTGSGLEVAGSIKVGPTATSQYLTMDATDTVVGLPTSAIRSSSGFIGNFFQGSIYTSTIYGSALGTYYDMMHSETRGVGGSPTVAIGTGMTFIGLNQKTVIGVGLGTGDSSRPSYMLDVRGTFGVSSTTTLADTHIGTGSQLYFDGNAYVRAGTSYGFLVNDNASTVNLFQVTPAGAFKFWATTALSATQIWPSTGAYWRYDTGTEGNAKFYFGTANNVTGFGTVNDWDMYSSSGGVRIYAINGAAYGGEIHFYNYSSGYRDNLKMDANGDWVPASGDNTHNVGVPSVRFSLIRGVTITSGDLQFENGWTVTESFKAGIAEDGLAFLDENDELVAVMTKTGFKFKGGAGAADVDGQPYVKTTNAERSQMDRHPEQRIKVVQEPVFDADGKPVMGADGKPAMRAREVSKTPADVRPLPNPATGKSNAQRKDAALKAGGHE